MKLISFKALEGAGESDVFEAFSDASLRDDELEYLCELISDISASAEDGVELAFSVTHFSLAVRFFDLGRYSFLYPVMLSERADARAAVLDVCEYARREELPAVFTDIPSESLGDFLIGFRHVNIDAEDPAASSYRAEIKTECELMVAPPEFSSRSLSFGKLRISERAQYARLCRDAGTNRYWGGDYAEDSTPEKPDSYFAEEAELEFERGLAVSLAIRRNDGFIGEAVFYAFDGMGEAEIAIRILPEFRGLGLGSRIMEALMEAAPSMGLVRLGAQVMRENKFAISLVSKYMEKIEELGDRVLFRADLMK